MKVEGPTFRQGEQKLNSKKLIWGYFISIIGLFFYSFTQVDLGLTLSKLSTWQIVQKYFQSIGYFQRSLSSSLFVIIIALLFFFYLMILHQIQKNRISKRSIWILIIAIVIILSFSYNAFSYDLFNYIFDAKIVTYYHLNPYMYKALDFPGDSMLSFMHWTHRVYPYGPIWLILTAPISFIGFQIFLPTFFLFKIFISICFLGTVFYTGKILQKFSPKDELFGIAFFALNPLVITESLVSAHNDIAMIFLAMWAMYLLANFKYVRSFILLFLSIGIKFSTFILAPFFLLIIFLRSKKKTINWPLVFAATTASMIIPVFLASHRTTFQPWYLLSILPFAALVAKKYYVFIPSVIISIFAVFEYLPFLYLGNWGKPVPLILFWMTAGSVLFSAVIVMVKFLRTK